MKINYTQKVIWRNLVKGELLQCGDMWSSHDPNTPERQSSIDNYNLQMQAVHTTYYGTPAYEKQYDNGSLWRPTGISKNETSMI